MCHMRCPHEDWDGQCTKRYLPPDCPMAKEPPPNMEDITELYDEEENTEWN